VCPPALLSLPVARVFGVVCAFVGVCARVGPLMSKQAKRKFDHHHCERKPNNDAIQVRGPKRRRAGRRARSERAACMRDREMHPTRAWGPVGLLGRLLLCAHLAMLCALSYLHCQCAPPTPHPPACSPLSRSVVRRSSSAAAVDVGVGPLTRSTRRSKPRHHAE
jgi:hypothetical protein